MALSDAERKQEVKMDAELPNRAVNLKDNPEANEAADALDRQEPALRDPAALNAFKATTPLTDKELPNEPKLATLKPPVLQLDKTLRFPPAINPDLRLTLEPRASTPDTEKL